MFPDIHQLRIAAPLLVFIALNAAQAEERAEQQLQLAPFQAYVGDWKGTGQVRRGSTQGAWTEQASWAWKYDAKSAQLVVTSANGKHFRSATLAASREPGVYALTLVGPEKQSKALTGRRDDDGKLVLTAAAKADDGLPDRATFRVVAGGDRLVLLLEKRVGDEDRFTQLAEIGYTRVGSGFGQGAAFRECIVTGGRGTIEVSHAGKTYYVCCTGCRDLFNDDPEGVLREYEARKKKEREAKAK